MGVGALVRADANLYLILGLPLTVGFQRYVRRRPLYELWVRDASSFDLDRQGKQLAVGLAVVPALLAIGFVLHPTVALWGIAGVGGAIGAGFAISRADGRAHRALRWCLVNGGVVGIAIFIVAAVLSSDDLKTHPGVGARIASGVGSMVIYLPIVFALEEVTFRGLIDTHVHTGDGSWRGWRSAVGVSVLWGLWHLPITGSGNVLANAGALIGVHVPIGIFLSLAWRRGGNLLAPGATHALVDAVRNALLLGH
jgi:membrane protease YdiL (CAAX protease family)